MLFKSLWYSFENIRSSHYEEENLQQYEQGEKNEFKMTNNYM